MPIDHITYKEDPDFNVNTNLQTRYGGSPVYAAYDQLGNKVTEFDLKPDKEIDQRYKNIGESPESESLQDVFKWQYEQELMKVLGDDYKGISDEDWKNTRISNVLDSLKNDAYRFGWEFDPTHTGKASLRKSVPETIQELPSAAAYTVDNVLADWFVQNPLNILFGDKYGPPRS